MTSSAREEILARVRAALNRDPHGGESFRAPSKRASIEVVRRQAGEPEAEINLLLAEIAKLGGATMRLVDRQELPNALGELVQSEKIRKATLWTTPDLGELEVAAKLAILGVEIVQPTADTRALAECDLGVTGVDAAIPESGTLVLLSSPERRRSVSLLPRVHLAIVTPRALSVDLREALGKVKGERYVVLVSGPSRTADIELVLTLGMHGPKALHVWVLP